MKKLRKCNECDTYAISDLMWSCIGKDDNPIYLCEECSEELLKELKNKEK